MNTEAMRSVLEKIKQYNKIVLTRHIRPDGDAVGSTLGLKRIINLTFPEKEALVINGDYSARTAFLGAEDAERDDEYYSDALCVVLDTGTPERISNKKYCLAKEIAVIDHHIQPKAFGKTNWVESERTSACEMIAELYAAFPDELKMDKKAAELIYAGMVTDSNRFRYAGVTGNTLRLAAMLLDMGIDTEPLYTSIYINDLSEIKYKAYILNTFSVSEFGAAHFFVSRKTQSEFGLTVDQASDAVAYLEGIKDCIIWIGFIENENGTVRVRLRSRFVKVNELAAKYSGGGHAFASGATLSGTGEVEKLLADADELCRRYKAENPGVM